MFYSKTPNSLLKGAYEYWVQKGQYSQSEIVESVKYWENQ